MDEYEISHEEMRGLKEIQLIDIREKEERDAGHMGGEWIPMQRLFENQGLISSDKIVVLYCRSGGRSLKLTKDLRKSLKRNDIYSLKGGICAGPSS